MRYRKLDIESYVNDLAKTALADVQPAAQQESGPLESVLRGRVIELWSDVAGGLYIVADEDDIRRVGEPRGKVYTAAEMRLVVQISDPAIVLEIHEWKRTFDGRLREIQEREPGRGAGAAAADDGGEGLA